MIAIKFIGRPVRIGMGGDENQVSYFVWPNFVNFREIMEMLFSCTGDSGDTSKSTLCTQAQPRLGIYEFPSIFVVTIVV